MDPLLFQTGNFLFNRLQCLFSRMTNSYGYPFGLGNLGQLLNLLSDITNTVFIIKEDSDGDPPVLPQISSLAQLQFL
jgi:hypothetical protein